MGGAAPAKTSRPHLPRTWWSPSLPLSHRVQTLAAPVLCQLGTPSVLESVQVTLTYKGCLLSRPKPRVCGLAMWLV